MSMTMLGIWPNDSTRGAFQHPHLHSHGLHTGHFSLTVHQHALHTRQAVLNIGLNIVLDIGLNIVRKPTSRAEDALNFFRHFPAPSPLFRHSSRLFQKPATSKRLNGRPGGRPNPGAQSRLR